MLLFVLYSTSYFLNPMFLWWCFLVWYVYCVIHKTQDTRHKTQDKKNHINGVGISLRNRSRSCIVVDVAMSFRPKGEIFTLLFQFVSRYI